MNNSETTITGLEPEIRDWAIEVGEKETDFLIWDIGNIPELEQQDNVIFEYNQWNSLDCTIYSSFWAISDLQNYEFNSQEINEMVEKSFEMWRIRGRWWQTQSWVDCARQYWNEKNPDNKVISVRTTIGSSDFLEAFEKWYTIVVTYKGNSVYNLDSRIDWVVDGTEFKPRTYWHATSLIKIDWHNIKDSYKGRTWNRIDRNIYKLADIEWLVRDWTYYPACYYFVKEKQLEKNLEEIKRLSEFRWRIEQNIKNNSDMRHLTNSEEFKWWLNKTNNEYRKKLEDIRLEELKNS
jgi:hypothetical protein